MDKISLLIASDDSSARRGLATIFASEDVFEVLGAFSLDEAIDKAVSLQPDAVLFDMPGDITNCGPKLSEVKKRVSI